MVGKLCSAHHITDGRFTVSIEIQYSFPNFRAFFKSRNLLFANKEIYSLERDNQLCWKENHVGNIHHHKLKKILVTCTLFTYVIGGGRGRAVEWSMVVYRKFNDWRRDEEVTCVCTLPSSFLVETRQYTMQLSKFLVKTRI